MAIPMRDGITANTEIVVKSEESKSWLFSVIVKPMVDNRNSIPIAWTCMSLDSPIDWRYKTPGIDKEPVMPVNIPFAAPSNDPIIFS